MGSSLSKAVRHALGVATATIICFGLAVSLTGCPVAAELENKERFEVLGGGGGGGPVGCDRALPDDAAVGCNWRAALGAPGQTGYCYKGGCHNAGTHAGELDLTPDAFLISRVLNVPAANDIECPGAMRCDPAAATCANCAMCTAPGKVLVAQGGPPNTGWIFDKIEPFIPQTTVATMTIGCGDAMPTFNTTGTANYRQEHKDCLKMFFNYIAQTPGTWPCTPPPMGGAGGGGAGGAPMAGSGGT